MTGAAEWVVRLSARMLPAPMREVYREQWLADLRDAAELEVSRSEIAAGSLAFAFRAPRVGERRRRTPNVVGRSRLASALALSGAVLCMSEQLGNGPQGLSSNGFYNLVFLLGNVLLYLYMLLAPVVAVALVAVTRGVSARVRIAVVLFILASLAGAAHAAMNGIRRVMPLGTNALPEAIALFTAAIVLLAAGCVLIARRPAPLVDAPRSWLAAIVSLLALGAALGLGLANVLSLRAELHAADLAFMTDATWVDEPLALVAQSNVASITAIVVWAAAALVASLAVSWLAYTRPGHAVARGLALLFALMISHGALLTFVWLNAFGGPGVHLTVPEAVLLIVGRWGLLAVLLYSVGGVRLTRVGHRHDVEGRVELL